MGKVSSCGVPMFFAVGQGAKVAGLLLIVQGCVTLLTPEITFTCQKELCIFVVVQQVVVRFVNNIDALGRFVADLLKKLGFFGHTGKNSVKNTVDGFAV
ncbi:MAG: hypothetical protein LUH17_01070 [Acidaminococcaceae bacterium]|nr:hypothetical protein [Acidaminococcaceae bacterium]